MTRSDTEHNRLLDPPPWDYLCVEVLGGVHGAA